MKVYNQEKTQILTNYDLNKGYLSKDVIEINQPEIQAVEEQYHYETIKEYGNGGKDVKKVVDVAGIEYQPAKTYIEEIYVYIPYTTNELAKQEAQQEIQELKQKLIDTDYVSNKLAEAVSKYISTEDNTEVIELRTKYSKQLEDRQEWRDRINELEKLL